MVVISILFLLLAQSALGVPVERAEPPKHGFLTANVGMSRYFVDPDVDLPLSGFTLEMKWVRQTPATYPIWGFESSEKGFGLLFSKVLNGRIDVNDLSLLYAKRYNFRSGQLHPYAGFDTGLSWLISGDKRDERTGYELDAGLRPCLNINLGGYYNLKQYLTLGLNLKYSFSVKKVYLHNPFAPHKHADIFQYFSLGIDMKLGSRGIRSLLMALGLERTYSARFAALDHPSFVPFQAGSYPELAEPAFTASQQSPSPQAEDEVIGIAANGCAKADPLKIAVWHHLIHDTLEGRSILVTFCPLTYTAMVFDRTVDGRTLTFHTDGLIDNNMIMVDQQTGSKWVQITGEAIEGPMQGKQLKLLPSLHSRWDTWHQRHHETLVLSPHTGFDRNYDEYPFGKRYLEYRTNWRILFPLSHEDNRFHPKEVVLVLEVGKVAKAYVLADFGEEGVLNDVVAGQPVLVVVDRERQLASVFSRVVDGQTLEFMLDRFPLLCLKARDSDSRWTLEGHALTESKSQSDLIPIPAFKAYWFAWAAFHPDTLVYQGQNTDL